MSKFGLEPLFLVVFLLSYIEVAAADLRVPGIGLTLCETAITLNEDSNLNSPAKKELSGWAEGYMGGLFTAWMIDYVKSLGQNPATSELTVDYEPDRVWVRLIAYCQDAPSDTVADAVMATYTEAIGH